MLARVKGARRLRGTINLPGDKSISHRALMLNAIAEGEGRVTNLSPGADVASTAACVAALGRPLGAAEAPLDCGNSGTTMRLLAGLLSAQPFESVLVGDGSLSRRPMERVAEPLRRLGATADAGPPLTVGGGGRPRGGEIVMSTPSAQVKSALLLCGLFATGPTRVVEPVRTRDHTERMLAAMGAPIRVDGLAVTLEPGATLRAVDVVVPGDLSAAAFWVVAGTCHPDAEIALPGVGVNPTRAAILDVLPGVTRSERLEAGEPVADLVASTSRAQPLQIGSEMSAQLIDELPVLAVAAATIPGRSVVSAAGELRVKESDRIAAMAEGLRAMGAAIEERPDGWVIDGGRPLEGARVGSRGDHRIAMALAVAGLLADGETEIEDADSVAISYPGFWDDLERICR